MTGDNPEDVAAKAAVATAETEQQEETGEITLSNKIKLRVGAVPPLLLNQVRTQISPPKIPTFFNEDKQRDEENPNDPGYEGALQEYYSTIGMAVVDLLLLKGVEILRVPRGIPKWDSSEWHEDLSFVGIKVPSSDNGKRLVWLRSIALATGADVSLLMSKLFRMHGISEEDVAVAAESFRGQAKGRADRNGTASQPSKDGD
jgi:hypothetical protein